MEAEKSVEKHTENYKETSKTSEKIKSWLKDKNNLAFLGILILAIALRLYYFNITKSQPVWWDESDYLAYAKNLAGQGSTWQVTPHHNSLFAFILALMLKLSFSEPVMKFLLELIPALLILFLVYKICRLMYKDPRIALISTLVFTVTADFLFQNMRFHTEVPALLFAYLAFYTFFKGYEKKEKIFSLINHNWAIPLTVLFTLITYSIRRGFFFFGLFFLVYMFLTKDIKSLFKDKYNWIALAIALILFFAVESLVFTAPVTTTAGLFYNADIPLSWVQLGIFESYFGNPYNLMLSTFYLLFVVGLLVSISDLIFSFGFFKKPELSSEKKFNLFNFIAIILTLSFFLFYSRSDATGEARWYYPLLLSSIIMLVYGALTLYAFIKKYSKIVGVIIIVLLIGYGCYYELSFANTLIKQKATTYEGIKDAGLFLNQISSPSDTIISVPMPQAAYYAERDVKNPARLLNVSSNADVSLEMFLNALRKPENSNVKYLIVTFTEPGHPDWMQKTTVTNQGTFATWQIPFMDTTIDFTTGQQPNIVPSKKYGNLEFKFLIVKQDAFVYEIIRA